MHKRVVAVLSLSLAATLGFAIGASTSALPAAKATSSAPPIVVCSVCAYAGMPKEPHMIFLDPDNGELWSYSNKAMGGQAEPTRLGKLVLGKPVQK